MLNVNKLKKNGNEDWESQETGLSTVIIFLSHGQGQHERRQNVAQIKKQKKKTMSLRTFTTPEI